MRSCFELKPVISNGLCLSGFPPIPGHKSAEQGFVAALVAADKLTAADTAEEPHDEEEVCTTVGRPSHLCQLDIISMFLFLLQGCSPRRANAAHIRGFHSRSEEETFSFTSPDSRTAVAHRSAPQHTSRLAFSCLCATKTSL